MNQIKFKPQLTPKEMLKLGVFGVIILKENIMSIQKIGLKMPNLVIQDMMLILIVLKLFLVYQEMNG